MRTIIAGSRNITNYALVVMAVANSGFNITVVLCGDARGVDMLGEEWAKDHNVPVEHYPADWSRYGKRAGYIRNEEMGANAEALVAVWDGTSRGTEHMINIAREKDLKVYIEAVK